MVVPSARLMPYILDTGWIAVPRFQAPQVAHADVSALGQALLGEVFCPAHGAQLFAVDNRSPLLPLFHPAFRGAEICRRAPARLPVCGRRRISLAHKKASIPPWDRKIAQLRTQHKLSQKELARRTGVSVATVKNWEGDSSDPCLENIKSLSNIFNVTTDSLLGQNENLRLYHEELEEEDIVLLNQIIQYMVNQKHRDVRKRP